jgi:hypothetical protein
MPLPLLLPLLGLGLQVGSSIYNANKQAEYDRDLANQRTMQEAADDKQRRREALARALGITSMYTTKRIPAPNAPNLTGSNIVSGLGNVASQIGQNWGQWNK